MSDPDEKLKEIFRAITESMVEVAKVARDCPELTPEMVRDQVAPMVETGMKITIEGLEAKVNATFDGALDVAAQLMESFDVVSGAKAAEMIRRLKR